MKQQPGIATFGIICIVIGGLGVLFAPYAMLGLFGGPFFMRGFFPHLHRIFMTSPVASGYLLFTNVAGALGSLVLIICGIGILAHAVWARLLFLVYAVAKIALTTLSLSPNIVLLRRIYQPFESPAMVLGTVGGVLFQLLRWLVIVLFFGIGIWYFTRGDVRDVFASRPRPPAAPSGGQGIAGG